MPINSFGGTEFESSLLSLFGTEAREKGIGSLDHVLGDDSVTRMSENVWGNPEECQQSDDGGLCLSVHLGAFIEGING